MLFHEADRTDATLVNDCPVHTLSEVLLEVSRIRGRR